MAKQKEELDSREVMEPTNEEFRAIKAEYDALKRRLGSAEYKFISASDIEAIEASMDAETKEFLIEFNNENFTEAERVKFLIGPVVVVGPVSSTNSSKSLIFQNHLHSCRICFFSLFPIENIVKKKITDHIYFRHVLFNISFGKIKRK